ncbi:hypothetical protein Cni_G24647 [Canna indica]|uniref:Ent-kaurene synthase n=1 Tax=Canna indica TaxID=4628 RepID=A0AAQ3L0I9_9LILI|nr:hypothetical protein Cni_G24647 [Canna indica]
MSLLKINNSVRVISPRELIDHRYEKRKSSNNTFLHPNGTIDRIREQFQRIELSTSSYDTAWVAMVPSPTSPNHPCFPQCLDWILNNQHFDGSWGLHHSHPSLIKDDLSSTLACILALEKWKTGQGHVKRGLNFIESNFSCIMDEQLRSPIGFDIIFSGMLEYANGMGLDIPMDQSVINNILSKRAAELEWEQGSNCEGRKVYLAYVAEGLGNSQDWKKFMKYQRENGSLFNSPSTTAAALMHRYNTKAHEYLHSLLLKFGSSVPTAYPVDVHAHLRMVDNVERLGIAQHFRDEIRSVLDHIYRCWLLNDEEIFLDMVTCAMAFRILRMKGYNVSPNCLSQLSDVNYFNNTLEGYLKDVNAVLELYKASQVKILPNEESLDNLGSWSRTFLKQASTTNQRLGNHVALQEVEYALNFPIWSNLERLEHKRQIENFNAGNLCVLKTSYKCDTINNKDILRFALDDFNTCQSIYREELQNLENWVKDNNLDQLGFARQKQIYCYFSAAATLFSPEMSDARISWAKNSILTTIVDDFFDIGGSMEELVNLISLVEKWDVNWEKEACSEQVKIIFSCLFNTINELGTKASALQRRSTTQHLVDIWLSLMKSMMKEAEWQLNKEVPSVDDYMTNGYVSFALGPIILPALYFVGPELPEDVISHLEYHNLFKLVSTCGRLLNDIQGFEREGNEGKLNGLSLRILHSHGSTSKEEVKQEMQRVINSSRTELLRMVLQQDGSVVPRPCKDLFWKMCKILHIFYMKNDGFTSPKEMVGTVNAVIHEPLEVNL